MNDSPPIATAKVPIARRSESDEAIIYCGPSIGRVLKQYAVFTGNLSLEVRELVKKHPCVKKLLIPVSRITKVKMAVQTQGTLEYQWFQIINQEVNA
jgi:hypothetical protein